MKAVYPGSFDPITNGHIDIIKRSLKYTDKLTIGVLNNPSKSSLFSAEERVALIKEIVKDMANVEVKYFGGLLVDFTRAEDSDVIIRGFRTVSDYEYELQMAHVNYELDKNIETVFMVARNEYSHLSSSIVKDICRFGGDIGDFVPANVAEALKEKLFGGHNGR